MGMIIRRISIAELACMAALSIWTVGELHTHVESTSISGLSHADKFRTLETSYTRIQHILDSIQKSMLSPNGANMDEFSSRTAIASLMQQTGLSALDIPELSIVLNPTSSLSTYMLVEKRKDILESLPTTSPAEGWFASGFGERIDPMSGRKAEHRGLDISNNMGTPIVAPADGVVRYAATYGKFGNYISIVHGHGVLTKYGHLKEIRVKTGQIVHKGDVIALMGQSGKSTGIHLHYEVWINDHAFNPYAFLPKVMRHEHLDEAKQKFMLLAGQP